MQLGDNNRIVALTNITVVGDFRRRDMAYGGQGAPLVPAFHHKVVSHPDENRIILNIGGIANLTTLFGNSIIKGYDTGPGNMLLDIWANQHLNKPYDNNGDWARSGQVNELLLADMLADPYFKRPAPKVRVENILMLLGYKISNTLHKFIGTGCPGDINAINHPFNC